MAEGAEKASPSESTGAAAEAPGWEPQSSAHARPPGSGSGGGGGGGKN